jgi:hypothetical protein
MSDCCPVTRLRAPFPVRRRLAYKVTHLVAGAGSRAKPFLPARELWYQHGTRDALLWRLLGHEFLPGETHFIFRLGDVCSGHGVGPVSVR